jgi:ATP-dependent Clp protease ATP-binding subunit ClpX
LLAYGFIPEFVGRLPVVSVLSELNEGQLVSILTEPKNALIKQYAKLLAMEGVELKFAREALRELAARAMNKGTGARALRSLLEKLMLDVMYEVPSRAEVTSVTVTGAVARGDAKPLLRRKSRKAAA